MANSKLSRKCCQGRKRETNICTGKEIKEQKNNGNDGD